MAKKKKKDTTPIYGADHFTAMGRLNFIRLIKPEAYQEGGKLKWSLNYVGNEDGPKMQAIIQDCLAIKQKVFGDQKVRLPFAHGKDVLNAIEDPSEATIQLYTGRIRLVASSSVEGKNGKKFEPPKCYLADGSLMPRRPGNDQDLRAIEDTFYDGVFGAIAVSPYSYGDPDDELGARGVSLILRGVRFVKDGKRLGGINVDKLMHEEVTEEGDWGDDLDGGENGAGQEDPGYTEDPDADTHNIG